MKGSTAISADQQDEQESKQTRGGNSFVIDDCATASQCLEDQIDDKAFWKARGGNESVRVKKERDTN